MDSPNWGSFRTWSDLQLPAEPVSPKRRWRRCSNCQKYRAMRGRQFCWRCMQSAYERLVGIPPDDLWEEVLPKANGGPPAPESLAPADQSPDRSGDPPS